MSFFINIDIPASGNKGKDEREYKEADDDTQTKKKLHPEILEKKIEGFAQYFSKIGIVVLMAIDDGVNFILTKGIFVIHNCVILNDEEHRPFRQKYWVEINLRRQNK